MRTISLRQQLMTLPQAPFKQDLLVIVINLDYKFFVSPDNAFALTHG
jgi:hypothetical protein